MNKELIKDLHLILGDVLKDKAGYEQAAHDTDDEELKRVFTQIGEQKTSNAIELKNILINFGDEDAETIKIEKEKSDLSKDITFLFTNNGDKSIVEGCIIRENTVAAKYQEVLSKEYPEQIAHDILENQLSKCMAIKSILWEQSARFKSFVK